MAGWGPSVIRTQAALDELTRDQAYMLGWQDHADQLELAADGEAALQASRSGRRLEDLLDRVWQIAPYEIEAAPVADVEPVEVVVEGRPFDWEIAA